MVEQTEIRMKDQLRTLQSENTDLKFLVDQKDIRHAKLDKKIAHLKEKLDESLSKLYYPSQDEVIQGLNQQPLGSQEHNIVKGGQEFQVTHELAAEEGAEQVDVNRMQQEINSNNEGWAQELTKADERNAAYKSAAEELEKRKKEVEDRFEHMETQIQAREDEIQRLNDLYQGGQHMERLNLKYLQD